MEFVDIPEEKILRRQFLKTTFLYLLALSQKVKNVFYFTHLFVNLFVFLRVAQRPYTHIRPCVQLKSGKIYILLFFRKHCLNRTGMTDKFFPTNCCIFFRIYLLKMSCGKRRKWHFQDRPKLKNFLENMVLIDSPSLERLLHSYFSFLASPPKSHATPKVFDRCY